MQRVRRQARCRQGTAASTSSNDLIAWITVDDLFGALRRRADLRPYLGAVIATAASALARLGDTGFIADRTTLVGALRVGPCRQLQNSAHGRPPRRARQLARHFRFAACADGSACIVVARSDAQARLRAAQHCCSAANASAAAASASSASALPSADAAQYSKSNADNLLAACRPSPARTTSCPLRRDRNQDIVRCLN